MLLAHSSLLEQSSELFESILNVPVSTCLEKTCNLRDDLVSRS